MRVIVCGGRKFADRQKMNEELRRIEVDKGPITMLIHGGAPGADTLAAKWARDSGLDRRGGLRAFPANWVKYGNAAGPIRNGVMLARGRPDLVIAFPGKFGTADMVEKARAAGVEVIEVKP